MEDNIINDNNAVNPWGDSPAPVTAPETPVTPITPETPPTDNPPPIETPEIVPPEVEPEKETLTPAAEKVVEVEKIVEKIVEKHPEFKDDDTRALYEAILTGGEREIEVKKYLDEKYKDYNSMSDIDAVKEQLKKSNPSWSSKDIEAEIRFKYGKSLETIDLNEIDRDTDPEAYDKAVQHNDDVERRELLLERDGRDARIALNESKKTIELPKIPTSEKPVETPPQLTQEEVDELNRKWEAEVTTAMAGLGDLKFNIGDEEVTYKLTDEEKSATMEFMKGFTGEALAKDLGWMDENGNENLLKIAEDRLKLKAIEKILSSAATQSKTAAKKEVIAEIKNIDTKPKPDTPEVGVAPAEAFWG